MTDDANSPSRSAAARFPFSIGSTVLWVTIVGLAGWNFATQRELSQVHREISQVRRELDAEQPLAAKEVARQFQQSLSHSPVPVTVEDVRYSPKSDTYRIEFAYTNSKSQQRWKSEVILKADGYGTYMAEIENSPFTELFEPKRRVFVSVKSPSPLIN